MIIIVTGVAGSGKSTIARTLARKLRIDYVDADTFHSSHNVEKMRSGQPLTDADRAPWLQSLRSAITDWIAEDRQVVLACSALKRSYRDLLCVDAKKVRFAYLKGNYELFHSRLTRRTTHFMHADMLASQLATLEEPGSQEAIICDARQPIKAVVEFIKNQIDHSL